MTTIILPPNKWNEELENLPFKAGRFEAMTADEAIANFIPHPYGDEIVTVSYEKEVFYEGEGWEWVPCPQIEATLARLNVSSVKAHVAAEKRAIPLGMWSGGYNDRT